MRLLFLTSRFPYPPVGGDRLRTFAFIKYLSARHRLDLLTFYDNKSETNHLQTLAKYCENIYMFRRSNVLSCLNALKSFINRKPLQVNFYTTGRIRDFVRSISAQYDHVIAHLLRMAEYVMNMDANKIIDMTDCLSESWKTQASYVKEPLRSIYLLESRYLKLYEASIHNTFDHLLYVTPEDAAMAGGEQSKLTLVGNGLNIEDLPAPSRQARQAGLPAPADSLKTFIGFLGKLDTVPNRDAVNYFISDIFPLIRQKIDGAKFLIIGKNPDPRWASIEGCEVTGEVDDVRVHLSKCLVFVCPLRCGGGFKNKIVEAMLTKVPVVATSISILGMGIEPGRHVITADDAVSFANSVVCLMNDPARREKLANEAYKLAKEAYSWETELKKVDKILCRSNSS